MGTLVDAANTQAPEIALFLQTPGTTITLDAGASKLTFTANTDLYNDLDQLLYPGSLTIAGPVNSFVVQNATLDLITQGSLTLQAVVISAPIIVEGTVVNPGALIVDNSSIVISGGVTLNANTSILIQAQPTFSGPINMLAPTTTLSFITNYPHLGNITLGGGVINVPTSYTITAMGIISGQNLVKSGAGTLELANLPTFTGSAVVAQGKLVLSGSNPLGTATAGVGVNGVLDVAGASGVILYDLTGTGEVDFGSGSIQINDAGVNGFSGVLSGSGGVTVAGVGTCSLSGVNTYTGVTTLSTGTLALSGDGSVAASAGISASSGTILDISGANTAIGNYTGAAIQNPTIAGNIALGDRYLWVTNTAQTEISGVISGAGGVVKAGASTLILSVPNTYQGSTIVEAGTLQLNNGTAIASSENVINNGTMDVSGVPSVTIPNLSGTGVLSTSTTATDTCTLLVFTDSTYEGTFTGSAIVEKTGGATLTLATSSPLFNGEFVVNDGALVFNGDFSLVNLTVGPGGVLSGNITLHNLINMGMVSPGNSIGTLTVLGNYTQTGAYDVEIDPGGISDLIVVTGVATINPGSTLIVNPLTTGMYAEGERFTILTAVGGISGQFDPPVLPDGFDMSVLYNLTSVVLVNNAGVNVLPVNPSDWSGNHSIIGNTLFCSDVLSTGDMHKVKTNLIRLNGSEFLSALQRLAPTQISGLQIVELENNNRMLNLIQTRIFRYNEQLCDILGMLPDWTFWITPASVWLWQKSNGQTYGFRSNTTGFVFGLENNCFADLLIGLGTGYTHSSATWHQTIAKSIMNEVYLAPYLAYRWEDLAFSGSIMGSYDAIALNRYINFGDISRIATSHFNQWNFSAMLDTQAFIRVAYDIVYLLPEVQATFSQLFRQSASEAGADSLNLYYPSTFNSSMRIYANLAGGTRFCVSRGFLIDARLNGAYQYTQFFTPNDVAASFMVPGQLCDPTFVVDGNPIDKSQWIAGATLLFQDNDDMKVELNGSYTFGSHSNVLELNLAMEFNY